MSNWAPVLVVDGAAVAEVGGPVDGTVPLFFGAQPDAPNTATTDSATTAAAARRRELPARTAANSLRDWCGLSCRVRDRDPTRPGRRSCRTPTRWNRRR